MDLKLPITIIDELSEDEIHAQGELDLASGEIRNVRFEDHDVATLGVPATRPDYEFTVGILRNGAREDPFAEFVANLGIHPPTDIALLGRVFLALGGLLRVYAPRLDLPAIVAPIVIAAALQAGPATKQS